MVLSARPETASQAVTAIALVLRKRHLPATRSLAVSFRTTSYQLIASPLTTAIDCKYSWSAWSSCVPCGVGLISRTMVVLQPSANGGVSCPSAQVQTTACITKLCEDCSVPAYGPNHLGCLNNGACSDIIPFDGAFTCSCSTGFSGANCEIGLYIPLLSTSIITMHRTR